MTYAAYLRVYEPVSAFHEPDRSRWAAYAASATRPRRRDALAAEHAEGLRRVIAAPHVVLPERESEHAYVRRADGTTYICPWQIRLRCLLGYGRMVSSASPLLPGTIPAGDDDQAVAALARLEVTGASGPPDPSARLHILGSVWAVPLAWFVPFAAAERWLSLGPGPGRPATEAAPEMGAAATAAATRALVYTTPMARARRRIARGVATLRKLRPEFDGTALEGAALEPRRAAVELAEVGRWLAEFHPYSLVELDYGGLVYLVSDDVLCGDQSVAEIRAAIDGAARGECELAMAMYMRAHSRWRAFAEFEQAN